MSDVFGFFIAIDAISGIEPQKWWIDLAQTNSTVLEVYNLQGGVLGFSHQRSGLGVVLSVSINSAPSKGPDTTLVPWKLTRMEAGTQYPWDSTATSYTPPHWRRQIGLTASLITFDRGSLEKCPNMLQKALFERSSNPMRNPLMFFK